MSKTTKDTPLAVPACGRAAAERILRKRFPRVPLPDAVRIMRDRRTRKTSRSSEKVRVQQETQED